VAITPAAAARLAAMSRRVELFYDVVSPYSYLALGALARLRCAGSVLAPRRSPRRRPARKPWDVELQLRPMFLGGVMQVRPRPCRRRGAA
jgi:2-hydroxychromene-2-carboxylate isomerase